MELLIKVIQRYLRKTKTPHKWLVAQGQPDTVHLVGLKPLPHLRIHMTDCTSRFEVLRLQPQDYLRVMYDGERILATADCLLAWQNRLVRNVEGNQMGRLDLLRALNLGFHVSNQVQVN